MAIFRNQQGAITRYGGAIIRSDVCCIPCLYFIERYNAAGSPDLEVELSGWPAGGSCGAMNGTWILDDDIFIRDCDVPTGFYHEFTYTTNPGGFPPPFTYYQTITLNIGGRLDGDPTTPPLLRIDASIGGFLITPPTTTIYRLTTCNDVIDAIDDLFNGVDVEVPLFFSGTCAPTGSAILRVS